MKAHIGVDAESGLVHSMVGTAANVNDVTQAGALLHGQEVDAFGDAGYRGVHKRAEATGPHWHVAMQPGKRRKLDRSIGMTFMMRARTPRAGQSMRSARATNEPGITAPIAKMSTHDT